MEYDYYTKWNMINTIDIKIMVKSSVMDFLFLLAGRGNSQNTPFAVG